MDYPDELKKAGWKEIKTALDIRGPKTGIASALSNLEKAVVAFNKVANGTIRGPYVVYGLLIDILNKYTVALEKIEDLEKTDEISEDEEKEEILEGYKDILTDWKKDDFIKVSSPFIEWKGGIEDKYDNLNKVNFSKFNDMKTTLKDSKARAILEKRVASEHEMHHWEFFIRGLKGFKATEAREIVDNFIVGGSDKEVNIDFDLKEQIRLAVEAVEAGNVKYNKSIFTGAVSIIGGLIRENQFKRLVAELSYTFK